MTAIDSGHRSDRVYTFARRVGLARLLVVKGKASCPTILGVPYRAEIARPHRQAARPAPPRPGDLSRRGPTPRSRSYGALRLVAVPGEPLPRGWVSLPRSGPTSAASCAPRHSCDGRSPAASASGGSASTGRTTRSMCELRARGGAVRRLGSVDERRRRPPRGRARRRAGRRARRYRRRTDADDARCRRGSRSRCRAVDGGPPTRLPAPGETTAKVTWGRRSDFWDRSPWRDWRRPPCRDPRARPPGRRPAAQEARQARAPTTGLPMVATRTCGFLAGACFAARLRAL